MSVREGLGGTDLHDLEDEVAEIERRRGPVG
jgi:hypothetical protein